MKILLSLILLVAFVNVRGQKIEYFPAELNLQPYIANFLEPKIGFQFTAGKNDLRLDIGTSRDILHYENSEKEKFSFGADFFTYSRLRSESDFHFPVDAIDYLFGINFGYKKKISDLEFGARFRISHISTHFVDGHFDGVKREWRYGREPIVYSREFFELMPYLRFKNTRFYFGLTYIYNTTPEYFGRGIYQFGGDKFFPINAISLITPFVSYDFKLTKIHKFTGTNSFSAGIKFGSPTSSGLSILLNYFAGQNVHGQYYDLKEKFTSIGINLDI
ncbi:MAG: DUF1207 domain-containing protein [Chlorobiaceae bacterium]|nr:DUF1207 domain-containing protein [Chlorobiaceae bacterium]MBA4308931.1 DUF1207 domain-containing protein [Chlorobiaceae bacterium]